MGAFYETKLRFPYKLLKSRTRYGGDNWADKGLAGLIQIDKARKKLSNVVFWTETK